MTYQDSFGYLPVLHSFSLSCGSVTPLPVIRNAVETVEADANVDGYLYPPLLRRVTSHDRGKTWEEIPGSKRPALLHRLPATHTIELPHHAENQKVARFGLAGFIVHFLGFLCGRRLQFHDWWVDGRVALKSASDHSEPSADDAVFLLESAIPTWSAWKERQRLVALNALFLKSRTHVYELEWERFQAEYQVFDALYAVARDVGHVSEEKHRDRIPAVCKAFGIPHDPSRVDTIVRLRNDLLHEALWDGRMPGAAARPAAFYASIWLDRLSRRLTFALLGMRGQYLRGHWWSLSHSELSIEGSPSWQRASGTESGGQASS